MVAPTHLSQKRKRALVVQRDPLTRKQICDQLQHRGFEVDACASLAEARASYQSQQLVVATTDRDPETPSGFIAWLREQNSNGHDDPYILAISDPESSIATPAPNKDWDELLVTPLSLSKLKARIVAIETWVENRLNQQETGPALIEQRHPKADASPPRLVPPPPSKIKPLKPPENGAVKIQKPKARQQLTRRETAGAMSPLRQFQALIDNSPLAMAMFDREMRYLVVNKRWLEDFDLVTWI